jgi:hypothetical protein
MYPKLHQKYPVDKIERFDDRRKDMTVCVAAIADRTMLIGVADRMLTAGDVEFEPEQAKIWQFSPAIFALVSGDSAIQTEILKRVDTEVKNKIASDPKTWVNVKDVVDLYCRRYRDVRRESAEAEILAPLGLDFPSFFEKQSQMHSDFVTNIANRLSEYEFDSTMETLVIGKDFDGPVNMQTGEKLVYSHLYSTDKDKSACFTNVGFAAIGIGKFHAESQFMFSGHWSARSFDDTLLLSYAAKKRAEAAPGVGKATDIVLIGPLLGNSVKVKDEHIAELDKIYQKSRRANERAIKAAQNETKAFVARVRPQYSTEAGTVRPTPERSTESGKL